MHEDGLRGWTPTRHGGVTVRTAREGVAVSTIERDRTRVPVAEHREDVVRRLLLLGITPRLLRALLPEFRPIIDRVVGHD